MSPDSAAGRAVSDVARSRGRVGPPVLLPTRKGRPVLTGAWRGGIVKWPPATPRLMSPTTGSAGRGWGAGTRHHVAVQSGCGGGPRRGDDGGGGHLGRGPVRLAVEGLRLGPARPGA